MSRKSFHPVLDELPTELPVFPLSGVLLLPRAKLPLNIFESRYLRMVKEVLGTHRMVGMIQPERKGASTLYDTGCAGRVVSFAETNDGRFLVTLKGVCRFTIARELEEEGAYRRIVPCWDGFAHDLEEDASSIDRTQLIEHMERYFTQKGIVANWEAIQKRGDEDLVSSLSMVCPFEAREKQALLEVHDAGERAALIMTLLTMGAMESGGSSAHN